MPKTTEVDGVPPHAKDVLMESADPGPETQVQERQVVDAITSEGDCPSEKIAGDEGNPVDLEEDGERSVEDSGKAVETSVVVAKPSPKKQKKATKPANEVNAKAALPDCKSGQVRAALNLRIAPVENAKRNLLIFNIHGTLLDCSVASEKNPNSKIRPTLRTKTRRVYLRPWLQPFLSKCFLNFTVGFWSSKSQSYMEDILPTLTGRQQGIPQLSPLFVWGGKECEAIKFEDGKPSAWGKPLSKVYSEWPHFSPSNTVILDNNESRVSCNPEANVVITKAFYVADFAKLADDNNYLKSTLWPLLEALYTATDVTDLHSQNATLLQNNRTEEHDLTQITDLIGSAQAVEGEGTCGPHGSSSIMSPHLLVIFNSNTFFVCACTYRWGKGTDAPRRQWRRRRNVNPPKRR
jgi:hypothetical protein